MNATVVRTQQELQQLDEATLRRVVIIPLLRAMGFQDVEEYHSTGELGMDIVCWKATTGGKRENWAVVAKAVKLTGRAAPGPGTVGEVQTQVLQCIGGQYPDPRTGIQQRVHRCLVVSEKPTRREFIAAMSPVLKAAKVLGKIEFWNSDALWERYKQHVLSVPGKIDELLTLADSLDPDYRIEFGELSATKREIRLVPKTGGTHRLKPIMDVIEFSDTPEGAAAKQAIDELVRKGTPASVPVGAIQSFPVPSVLRDMLPQTDSGAWHIKMPPAPGAPDLVARVEFESQDGTRFSIDTVRFRVIGKGSEAVTLSNVGEAQVVPLDITLTLMQDHAQVHVEFRISYPQNAYMLLKLLRLQACVSGIFSVSIIDADTGLTSMYMPALKSRIAPPDPGYVHLVEDLAAVQQHVGVPIVFPGRAWTDDEEETVAMLRSIVQHGGYLSRWTYASLDWETNTDAVNRLKKTLASLEDGKVWMRLDEDEEVELFGVTISLGIASSRFHARFANEGQLRAMLERGLEPDEQIHVLLVPGDGDQVAVHYRDWHPTLGIELPEWMHLSTEPL